MLINPHAHIYQGPAWRGVIYGMPLWPSFCHWMIPGWGHPIDK